MLLLIRQRMYSSAEGTLHRGFIDNCSPVRRGCSQTRKSELVEASLRTAGLIGMQISMSGRCRVCGLGGGLVKEAGRLCMRVCFTPYVGIVLILLVFTAICLPRLVGSLGMPTTRNITDILMLL